jgi:hypothetical protein
MTTITKLAKTFEAASINLVKFNDKANNAKTESSRESNECKAEKWAGIMLEAQFLLEEFTIDELNKISVKYPTVLELV